MPATDWVRAWKDEARALHVQAARAYEDLYHLHLQGAIDEAGYKRRRAYYGVGSRPPPARAGCRFA